jgi:hypothetical protein
LTQPPGLQPSQASRRRRSWPRGHKRLTAAVAAFGLLLVIGTIATAAGVGGTADKAADPGPRSTTADAKASTGATVKANTRASVKAGTGTTAKARTGATAKAGTGATAQAGAEPGATAGATAGTKPSASSSSTATQPETAQDCLAQARAWLDGASTQQLAALEGALGALDAAGQAFVSAAAGHAASGDISAVEGAAGALHSAAGAVEANPGPSCVPGLRANLVSGAADYSEVASDADSAVGEYEAGHVSAAKADVEAARPLVAEANASISAAEAAENFSG